MRIAASRALQEALVSRMLLLLVVLCCLGVPASLLRIPSIGFQPVMVVHVVLGILTCVIYLMRRRIGYAVRAGWIILMLCLVSVTGVINFGLLSAGSLFAVAAASLTVLFFGPLHAVLLLALLISTLTGVGGLIVAGRHLSDLPVESLFTSSGQLFIHAVSGTLVGVVMIHAIGTLIRLLTRELEASEQARVAFDEVASGILVVTPDWRFGYTNDRFHELLDLPRDHFGPGASLEAYFRFSAERGDYGPVEVEAAVARCVEVFRKGGEHNVERMRPDGGRLQVTIRPLASGGLVAVYSDVTQMHNEVVAAERRNLELDGLVQSVEAPLIALDAQRRVTQWNAGAVGLTGIPAADMVGRRLGGSWLDDGSRERLDAIMARAAAGEKVAPEVLVMRRPRRIELLVQASPRLDATGRPDGVALVAQDITALRVAQHERGALADALDEIVEAVALFDAEDRYVFTNEAYRTLNRDVIDSVRPGCKFEEHLRELWAVGNVEGHADGEAWIEGRMERHRNPRGSYNLVRPDGIVLNVHEQRVRDGGMITIATDVTEHLAQQAKTVQQAKLASLGEMASGIAHEINQPLHVIRLAAGNLAKTVATGVREPAYLEAKVARIQQSVARAAAIIDQLRRFSRTTGEDFLPFNPQGAVQAAAGMIGEQLRLAAIGFHLDLPDACPDVVGDEIQLEQVVLNLVSNARDAIESREVACEPGRIEVSLEVAGSEVCIAVEDNGGGILEEALPRLFEPFYTTKEVGKGTGLGLSVSHGLVEAMGGSLMAANTAGGARFEIRLPVAGPGSPD